ncbi:MAG: hypothetical protein WCC04_03435 [Terriglobales bacterium]
MAKARACASSCLLFAVLFTGSLAGQVGPAQEGADQWIEGAPVGANLGYPQDWSSRHLVMPGRDATAAVAAGSRDPRYVYNMVMREVAIENERKAAETSPFGKVGPGAPRHKVKIDWAVSLENGYVPQNQFPAKYQFNVTKESCSADYLLLGLTVASGTQANLVGINNLYTGATPACNGGETAGQPLVSFAYNTLTNGGQIVTSPTISEDGTKVAFVESTTTGSYFHVLVLPSPIPATTGTALGTVKTPKIPSTCANGKPTTPGCMTTLTIETTATNSNSSPWIDYSSDTAYVGADNGVLYKINPVFGGGAPALVNDASNWPVTVSTNTKNNILTDPVYDYSSGKIFIGDGEGYLYSVNWASPGKTFAAQQTVGWAYVSGRTGSGDPGTGVVDAPIVVNDPANPAVNQVFAFTGCSYVVGIGGAITQLPATFTTGTPTTSNTVDLGSATGTGDCTGNNVHSGTFDNAFWLNGSASGHMIACGFVDDGGKPADPKMYMFPFVSNKISSTGATNFVINSNAGDECTPLSEFYNGSTDTMFFGVGKTGDTSGYLESSTLTTGMSTPNCTGTPTSTCVTAPAALGGTSGIVVDNQLANGGTNIYFTTLAPGSVNGQNCHVSGGVTTPYCVVKLTQSGLQ